MEEKVSPATVKKLIQNELESWRSRIDRTAYGKLSQNSTLIPLIDLSGWARCAHKKAKKITEFHSSNGNFSAYWATIIACGDCWARFIRKEYLEV